MLDDILALFRRRRAPARGRVAAGGERWAMQLETMGGPIRRVRGDVIPRTEPRAAHAPKPQSRLPQPVERVLAAAARTRAEQPRPERAERVTAVPPRERAEPHPQEHAQPQARAEPRRQPG